MVAPVAVLLLLVACSNAPSGTPGALGAGAQLYEANCQSCHGDVATGEGRINSAPPHGPSGHTWHHADGLLADIVLGRFDYPGKTMPSFAGQLSEGDVQEILAYVKTGWNEEILGYQAENSRAWEEQNNR
ncbi:MAG: Cytochrome c, mono- and diheme variants [Chloroflexi bacterium]|nr:MAG: Cytochrome c, mono- and diheme variants [Chloroflexota bacterium]